MDIKRKLLQTRLTIRFYRHHLLADIVITLLSMDLIHSRGLQAFEGVFWLKILSYVAIYFLLNERIKHTYAYYLNLGIRKITLWLYSLTIDFFLFIAMLIITYHL